jgi:hypothetical protein
MILEKYENIGTEKMTSVFAISAFACSPHFIQDGE